MGLYQESESKRAMRAARGSGRTAGEMLRCSWCRAFVTTRYGRCRACGHEPTGEHNWHRYA